LRNRVVIYGLCTIEIQKIFLLFCLWLCTVYVDIDIYICVCQLGRSKCQSCAYCLSTRRASSSFVINILIKLIYWFNYSNYNAANPSLISIYLFDPLTSHKANWKSSHEQKGERFLMKEYIGFENIGIKLYNEIRWCVLLVISLSWGVTAYNEG